MKKILLVYTGGTIGSSYDKEKKCRVLSSDISKMTLLSEYKKRLTESVSLEELFEESALCAKDKTLSENMTYEKLNRIICNIKKAETEKYAGIIVLHGSDTLSYTAALFSFVFSDITIPIMLVCGKKPPEDKETNAHINFKTAVDLIHMGIAPNVYVPYENSDKAMWLHTGTSIKQCSNYSENFFGKSNKQSFCLSAMQTTETLQKCKILSKNRKRNTINNFKPLIDGVLLIFPYTGLDYSNYNLENVKAVIHGSYHSGTICVERNTENENYSTHSLIWFAQECNKKGIPVFVAPSKMDSEQYSSMADLIKNTSAKLLDMTTESAYTKLLVGISQGYSGNNLQEYMQTEICNEFGE